MHLLRDNHVTVFLSGTRKRRPVNARQLIRPV